MFNGLSAADVLLSEFGLRLPEDRLDEAEALLSQLRGLGVARTWDPGQVPLFEAVYTMTQSDFSKPIQAAAPYDALAHAMDVLRLQLNKDYIHSERFSALLESLPLQIIVAHPDGEIWDFNAQAASDWGEAPTGRVQDLLGIDVLRDDIPPREIRRGNRTVLVSLSSVRVGDDQLVSWVCVGVDVSMQAEARRKLEHAHQVSLSVVRARTAFLGNISHEMRTPLQGIVGASESLLKASLPDQHRLMIEAIHISGQRLSAIVDDVLDLVRLEAGSIMVSPVATDLRRFLEEVSSAHRSMARARGLEFHLQGIDTLPPRVEVDPRRIQQILEHLLENAVQFTTRGSITVMATCQSGQLMLAVTDTGIGIPTSHISLIFEAFRQVDESDTRRHGGTGLGLALSRRLAERMGGTLSVTSVEGVGSSFMLQIPCPIVSLAEQTALNLEGMQVLVVDDNPINRLVAQRLLMEHGAHVKVACNGMEALQQLQTEHFAVVLMDCQMPGMDGYETTRRFRRWEYQQSGRQRMSIIALTASATGEEQERCREAGMDALLEKPLNVFNLRRQLHSQSKSA